ncbi:hypothetical protein AB4Y90_07915 [Chryseobacterium sp. 2TAF14]|uniref:hypothetical protein n=1 Tax=Chryseobacterium sp. 2TAF14 TaxID=3233007 RepID=UPI003F8F0D94
MDRKFSITIRGKDNGSRTTDQLSIMGDTKQKDRQSSPINTNEGQNEYVLMTEGNFESEIGEEEIDNVDLVKNLDNKFVNNEDLQEEEDWKYQNSNIESGFATGVTFQELSTAGQLLQEEILESDLEKQAVDIIQKIQGTELFNLLESSLGDTSKRIAILLRESISIEDEIYLRGINSSDDFDIGEYV